jgi:hypothetical protein
MLRHPRVPTTIADHRLAATRACVARGAGALTPAALVAALRDHGHGPWGAPGAGVARVDPPPRDPGDDHRGVTVCMHVRGQQATTASMVVRSRADGTRPEIHAALGNPCVSVFVPVPFDGTVPTALDDPATWIRFARLRDRVERDPDALRAIRDALAPVEARMWTSDAPEQDPGALDALDAALTGLGV